GELLLGRSLLERSEDSSSSITRLHSRSLNEDTKRNGLCPFIALWLSISSKMSIMSTSGLVSFTADHLPHPRTGCPVYPAQPRPTQFACLSLKNPISPPNLPTMYYVGAWPGRF